MTTDIIREAYLVEVTPMAYARTRRTGSRPQAFIARLWAACAHSSRRGTAEWGVRPPPCMVGLVADCWREMLLALGAAGYRAVAVDQRGYVQECQAQGHPRPWQALHLQSDALAFRRRIGAQPALSFDPLTTGAAWSLWRPRLDASTPGEFAVRAGDAPSAGAASGARS